MESNAGRDRPMFSGPVLTSLTAFVRAGLRPRGMFARAIVFVLAVKLIAVAGMMIFQHFANPNVTDAAVVDRVLGPPSRP
jgi:hypothetical protein